MKKLLLGAMLAAACITTDVNAAFGIRTKSVKAEVDTTLRQYAGRNYEVISTNIVSEIKALTKKINEFKKSKDKTTKKTLDGISKESKKISEFFESMKKKDSRTNIAKKGEKATQAAVALKDSLENWSKSKSPAWQSFEKEFMNNIQTIAGEVTQLANETTEGTYDTKKGKGVKLNIKALLTSLSTSFESIRGLFADEQANKSNSSVEANVVKQETPTQVEANVVKQETPPSTSPREFTASW
ncbi:MAG: hypothetical protein J6P84_06230 [Alphaproteobacteria bacterium]|nr:hypothetical protein [Alphaproteobacteria bacterium]